MPELLDFRSHQRKLSMTRLAENGSRWNGKADCSDTLSIQWRKVAGFSWGEKYLWRKISMSRQKLCWLQILEVRMHTKKALSVMAVFLGAETLSDLLGLGAPRLVWITSSAEMPQLYWILWVCVYIALVQLSCPPNFLLLLHHFQWLQALSCCTCRCLFNQMIGCRAKHGTAHFVCYPITMTSLSYYPSLFLIETLCNIYISP